MISERVLAESFASMWHEVLPMLTPSFMSVFNESHVFHITDDAGLPLNPVPIKPTSIDLGLLAEIAFHIAKLSHRENLSVQETIQDSGLQGKALSAAIGVLQPILGRRIFEPEVSDSDWNQVLSLGIAYSSFLQEHKNQSVEFAPALRGSGFVGACVADLSVGTTLYEVKTVTRNFAASDLRQLFVYLALQRATGLHRWTRGGLLNPRRRMVASFSIDYILFKLSGGETAQMVLDRIIDFFSDRGLVPDSTF